MNYPINFPEVLRPEMVADNYYPPQIKMVLYLCDRLLMTIHALSFDTNPHNAANTHWMELWFLNEAVFHFARAFGRYILALGFPLPPFDSPWWWMAARIGPHYDSIPLSLAN